MLWSPALPMGMALEGGEGGELDAKGVGGGGGVCGAKRRRKGLKVVSHFFIVSLFIHKLAHRRSD